MYNKLYCTGKGMKYILIALFVVFYIFWMLYLHLNRDFFEITNFQTDIELQNYFNKNYHRKNIGIFLKKMRKRDAICDEIDPFNIPPNKTHEFKFYCKYSTDKWWHLFHLQSRPYKEFIIVAYVDKNDTIINIHTYCSHCLSQEQDKDILLLKQSNKF